MTILKKTFCEYNNIIYLDISYKDDNDIENIIKKIVSNDR